MLIRGTKGIEFVMKVGVCIFVQNMESLALSSLFPVLSRGLNYTAQEVKRTCCLIVDNICKFVEDPKGVPDHVQIRAFCEGSV